MEIKVWEVSYSKEDIENYYGKAITDGEWNIVVDELYNNDGLYTEVNKYVMEIVGNALNE